MPVSKYRIVGTEWTSERKRIVTMQDTHLWIVTWHESAKDFLSASVYERGTLHRTVDDAIKYCVETMPDLWADLIPTYQPWFRMDQVDPPLVLFRVSDPDAAKDGNLSYLVLADIFPMRTKFKRNPV